MIAEDPILSARAFLIDLDGTTYLGDQLIEGAIDFIELLQRRNVEYLFLTNNSSKHPCQYREKLSRLGLEVPQEKVFSSSLATAHYLKQKAQEYHWQRLYVLGTRDLEEVFIEHGFVMDSDQPQVLVLGFDTTLTYAKLWKFCSLVQQGLPYIATHADINCPIPGGYMPDAGAMMACIKASTGRDPDIIVGKPNRIMVEMAAQQLGIPSSSLVMVGDRLYTDIALGLNSGIATVLVLSGETQRRDLEHSPYQPNAVFNHLGELAAYLEQQ